LAKWAGQQKVNYNHNKKAMKDPIKRKQWEETNKKYPQYLSSNKKQ
jgi:hypothetical protein